MKTSVWALLALIACPGFATAQQSTYICAGNGREIQQLRIYELNRDNRDHFHERFRDDALRIMKKYNFRVLDIWESDTGEKLGATMESSWKAFLADQEEDANGQPLVRLSFSPACNKKSG